VTVFDFPPRPFTTAAIVPEVLLDVDLLLSQVIIPDLSIVAPEVVDNE
jgi:hypothetical protein